MRKLPKPEEIFLNEMKSMITNFLIEDINYRNGHYENVYDIIRSNKNKAKYILEKMYSMKHLIDFDDV